MENNDKFKRQIHEYIQKRIQENGGKIPDIATLNRWVGEFSDRCNNSARDEFEGYSSSEMTLIVYFLWEKNCPVRIRKMSEGDLDQVPILRQATRLLEIVRDEVNVKLTKTQALPTRIVKELYGLGSPEYMIEKGFTKLYAENTTESVQIAHILLQHIVRAVKIRNGAMSLTAKGRDLISDRQALLEELLVGFTTRYNMSYFDMYESPNIGKDCIGFTFVLLEKYGDKERPPKFYSDNYFNAFPVLLEEIAEDNPYYSPSEGCYSTRVFRRFLVHFGLVSLTGSFLDDNIVKKTPLFDKMIEITPPAGGAKRASR